MLPSHSREYHHNLDLNLRSPPPPKKRTEKRNHSSQCITRSATRQQSRDVFKFPPIPALCPPPPLCRHHPGSLPCPCSCRTGFQAPLFFDPMQVGPFLTSFCRCSSILPRLTIPMTFPMPQSIDFDQCQLPIQSFRFRFAIVGRLSNPTSLSKLVSRVLTPQTIIFSPAASRSSYAYFPTHPQSPTFVFYTSNKHDIEVQVFSQ